MLIILNPSGPLHIVFNQFRGISTAAVSTAICTCTMQVRLMGRTALGTLLVSITERGAGTVSNLRIFTQLSLQFENIIMKFNHTYIFNEGE